MTGVRTRATACVYICVTGSGDENRAESTERDAKTATPNRTSLPRPIESPVTRHAVAQTDDLDGF